VRCDRLHATLSVEACLRNQERSRGGRFPGMFSVYPGTDYHPCRKCPQGIDAREGRANDGDVIEIMREVAGRISETPAAQEERMEEAVTMRMCSRHGKGCPIDGPQPLENFPGDKNAKSGHKSYCKACQGIWHRARRARKRAEKAGKLEESSRLEAAPTARELVGATGGSPVQATNENEQRQALPPAKETAPAHLLTLDFSRYPNLLEMVKRQAEEDLRLPENQVLWILKQMEASWREH